MGIYVVSHKEINESFPKGYKTIIVNANNNQVIGDVYDNIGDNISNKNASYCELTALYWLWKNCSDEFVGIDHYRRFFMYGGELLDVGKAKEVVKANTVIVPKKEVFSGKIGYKYWSTSGYKDDLKVIRSAIEEYSPDYCKDYDTFLNQNKMYCYNMLIMNKQMYNSYCEWLFNILERVENRLDLQHKGAANRKGYYKRIYGFMGERLLNVYLIHNKLDVKELPVKFTGNSPKIKDRINNKLVKIKDKYLR